VELAEALHPAPGTDWRGLCGESPVGYIGLALHRQEAAAMFDAAPLPRYAKHKRPVSDLEGWAADALRAIRATDARPDPQEQWSPRLVGEALIEALKWARWAAGRTGPAGYFGLRLPEAALSADDRLALGWDAAPGSADDPADLPPPRIRPTAAQVSRHMAALEWPAVYLCPNHYGSARMCGLWAASKAYRRSFDGALKARGVHRSLAYRLRDRGLSLIAQGLDRDRVPFL